MKKLYIFLIIGTFAILAGFVHSKTLTVQDHTKVMKFLLDHPKALQIWLKSRGRSGSVSSDEVFNFISRLAARTRSSLDIVSIVNRAKNLSHKTRKFHPRGAYNNVIGRIRAARSLAELRRILAEERNKFYRRRTRNSMIANLSMGLEIASQIIEDGVRNGIYSPESYSVFLRGRKTRGIAGALWDQVVGIAQDDAIGAVVGCLVGPEGAVAGAIEASTPEVAETVIGLVTGGAEPAY